MAWLRELPHICGDGRRDKQTAGREGMPKSLQRWSAPSWAQGTPAGLPCGMPGMGELMDGAVQQAPQCGRQCMATMLPRQPRAS